MCELTKIYELQKQVLALTQVPPYKPSPKPEQVATLVPTVASLPDQEIAESFATAMTDALQAVDLTNGARQVLEMGLQGTIEVDVGHLVSELKRLVDTPLEGLMEANRIGVQSQLYGAAEQILGVLLQDLAEMEVPHKVRLLNMILGRIKTLQEIGISTPMEGSTPKGVRGRTMELTQTRTLRVNFDKEKDKTKVDEQLGFDEERPGEDYFV